MCLTFTLRGLKHHRFQWVGTGTRTLSVPIGLGHDSSVDLARGEGVTPHILYGTDVPLE